MRLHDEKKMCNCYAMFYNDLDSRLRGNDIELVDCFVLTTDEESVGSAWVMLGGASLVHGQCSGERQECMGDAWVSVGSSSGGAAERC